MSEEDPTLEMTDENFDDLLEENDQVFVDFWATWCGPCKAMEPIVEELAEKYGGDVLFGKVNTEDNSDITSRYGIQAIPTFLFIKDGEVVDQARGALPQEAMDEKINKHFDV